ncbi:MAG TPA: hypothetical protein VFN61_16545 [Acidimicrobiales bacterium]|nr:hypothetical protein [Acidimicrobiales bacterium]
MNIAPVSSATAAGSASSTAIQNNNGAQANAPKSVAQSNARSSGAGAQSQANAAAKSSSQPPAGTIAELVQASSVPVSVLKMAQGDGDGLTGVAALNDGDAAAQQAAVAAKMG